MTYWQRRAHEARAALEKKNLKAVEKQMRKYYASAAKRIINDFESTYNKILATRAEGREPTPADLYNLDKYWSMQASLRNELRTLGEHQVSALTKVFELHFFDIYYSIDIEGMTAFSTIDKAAARQLINSVWAADGKSWSSRVWANTSKLAETLNEQLLHCVLTGKKTSELKKLLQERFNVSYGAADTLARTELAHIQVTASAERYKSYGLEEYEFYAAPDERTCPICGKLHGKKFSYAEMRIGENAAPLHPRCRCDILPVIK